MGASTYEEQEAARAVGKGPVKDARPDKVDTYAPEQLGLQPAAKTAPAGSPTGA
jgi:hypothetical protein